MKGFTAEQKQSALRDIVNNVFTAASKEEALRIVNAFLDEPGCVIRSSQRKTIKLFANRCGTLLSLQKYVSNSLLFFEGNRVTTMSYQRR